MDIGLKLNIIAGMWLLFLLFKYLHTQSPGKALGVRRWHIWQLNFYRRFIRTPRLCSKHVNSFNRPGIVGILDQSNCDICKKVGNK